METPSATLRPGDTFVVIRTTHRVVEISSAGYVVTEMPDQPEFGRHWWSPRDLAALMVRP